MPRKPARRKPRPRKRKKKSALVPALVLMSAAGAAAVAAGVLFSRDASPTPDDPGFGLPAPDVADIGAGGNVEIKLTDDEDRDRVVAVIAFDSQTPVGQGRYDTVNPRAWVYLNDGSYLHIRADEGRFYAPDEQRPQSGVMNGNVVVRLFDPAPQRPADDAVAPVIARLDVLDFDTEYGAVTTNSPGLVITPEFEFAFNDLRLVVNQVQERIELLEVRQGGRITYTPLPAPATPTESASTEAAERRRTPARGQMIATSLRQPTPPPPISGPQATAQSATPATASPTPPPPPPTPVHYLAHFRDTVRITQDTVAATGDSLEVWARVVDNKLPEGAVGSPVAGNGDARPRGATALSTASQIRGVLASMVVASTQSAWPPRRSFGPPPVPRIAPADSPSSEAVGVTPPEPSGDNTEPPPPTPGTPEVPNELGVDPHPLPTPDIATNLPVTLEWSGPLTLRPLAAEPSELRRDHLVARLTGGEGGGVYLADSASGATGVCTRLDYAFTTRSLVLAGVGDTGVRLSVVRSSDSPEPEPGPSTQTPETDSEVAPIDTTVGDAAPGGGTPSGVLRAGRAEYSIATGIGRVPGPGTLEGEAFQRIGWNRQMDFVLRSEGERVLTELEEVIFQGDVHGEDDAATFDADYARAEFVQTPDQRSAISAITLEDAVSLRGREEERVTADSVRVEFTPVESAEDGASNPATDGDSTPSFFEAQGDVLATRPGERLAASRVEATLSPGADGRPSLNTLTASGGVDLRARRDDIAITGDDLDIDLPSQRLWVRGAPDLLARVARGPTVITGPDVRLGGQPRSASIFGQGTFSHVARSNAQSGLPFATEAREGDTTTFDAAWSQVMTFDDSAGTLRCVGDVDASMKQGDSRADSLQAWTIDATFDPTSHPAPAANAGSPETLDLTTAPAEPGAGAASTEVAGSEVEPQAGAIVSADDQFPDDFLIAPTDGPDQNRRLLTVIATGSIVDSPDGEPATIESRRYAPIAPDGSRALAQLYYLQGPTIIANNAAGTLDVPGAGKLMVVDRRTPDDQRPATPDASPFAAASSRGDALFDWQGSLTAQRSDAGSSMTMTDRVRMTHRRTSDNLITSLEAPVLIARTGGTAQGEGERVQHVHAEGGVWVGSGGKEVTADSIDYNADTGILIAVALLGNQVRVMDGPNIWHASAVRFDTIAGRIEIANPGDLVSPR